MAHRRGGSAPAGRDLRLQLKDEVCGVLPVTEGLPWLGFRVFPGTTRADRATRGRFMSAWRRGDEDHPESMASRVQHLRQADTLELRRQRWLDDLE